MEQGTADATFDVPVAVAYDPRCAQKQLDANFEEIRNGWDGDFSGQQERAILSQVDGCEHSFKANYQDHHPTPGPPPTPANAWWKNRRLWIGIVIALILVAITVWAAKRGYVPTVQL